MADITMCKGGKCELKKQCYRFTAKPDDYQAYFVGLPYLDMVDKNGEIIENPESKDCKHFWSNKDSKK